MLGLKEFTPLVKDAFDREFVPPESLDFKYFEEDLAFALKHPEAPHRNFHREFRDWTDTIGELQTWNAFSEEYLERKKRSAEQGPVRSVWRSEKPAVNPHKGVGRNDPCPCGSGKKFKKCCGAQAA
jgi:uncharacterized protein